MPVLLTPEDEMAVAQRSARLFLISGFIITLAILAAVLWRQGVFKQTTQLGVIADSAIDLKVGMSVKVAGFRIGSVSEVALRPDGKVEVQFRIDSDQMRFVTRDATVELRREGGLIGAPVLEILPGAEKTVLATEHAVLGFARAKDLSGVANELREKIVPILSDVGLMTRALSDPRQGVPSVLAQLRSTLSALDALTDSGSQQVNQLGPAVVQLANRSEQTIASVGETVNVLNHQLPELLSKLQGIAKNVEKISIEAEKSIPSTLRDGAALASEARTITDGVKQSWPLRQLIETPTLPARLKADSDPYAEGGRVESQR